MNVKTSILYHMENLQETACKDTQKLMDTFSLIHGCIIPQNYVNTESILRILVCYPEISLPKGIFLTTMLHKLVLQ